MLIMIDCNAFSVTEKKHQEADMIQERRQYFSNLHDNILCWWQNTLFEVLHLTIFQDRWMSRTVPHF